MLDTDYIEVGKVAVAYDLDDSEINALVDAGGAFFGPFFLAIDFGFPSGQPYSYESSLSFAKKYIAALPCIDELSTLEGWESCKLFFRVKECTIDYFNLASSIHKHQEHYECQGQWEKAQLNCYAEVLSLILRDGSLINKPACIAHMHACGYPLRHEVKGITHNLIATIQTQSMLPLLNTDQRAKAQGGSNKETDKIKATHEACERVVDQLIKQRGLLDGRGKIGFDEFSEEVQNSMTAHGTRLNYQVSAAKLFFKLSEKLLPFKRKRGEKK